MIKNILIFGVGVAIGALSACLITKKKYKDMYEQLIQEEISSIRENFNSHDRYKSDIDKKIGDTEKEDYKKIAKSYYVEGDINPSNAASDPPNIKTKSNEEVQYYKYQKASIESNNCDKNDIYVISIEQFHEEMDHYDKLTIYYYEDDDTMTDDTEEIISDVITLIGENALYNFGNMSDDPEVVFIRNEKLEADYEVIRLSKSYKETVMGNGE